MPHRQVPRSIASPYRASWDYTRSSTRGLATTQKDTLGPCPAHQRLAPARQPQPQKYPEPNPDPSPNPSPNRRSKSPDQARGSGSRHLSRFWPTASKCARPKFLSLAAPAPRPALSILILAFSQIFLGLITLVADPGLIGSQPLRAAKVCPKILLRATREPKAPPLTSPE